VSAFRWLARSDPAFPPLLAAIHDPPSGLFLRGSADPRLLQQRAVAVVGARACSPYGTHVGQLLGRELAAAGVVVVSGLARGVDGAAHQGALEVEGATVAVLGCGIDRDYPASNRELARGIVRGGLIVSEYDPGIDPASWRFPARNRIIAGLAKAVVIVEARERSGALITADFALEEGREVFAVPGEMTSALSAGTNELIRLGAAPVTKPADVLDALGVAPPRRPRTTLSAAAEQVLACVADSPAGIDALTRSSGLDAGAVAAAVSELELAGLMTEAAGVFRPLTAEASSALSAPRRPR
jgi:DNA processing protein